MRNSRRSFVTALMILASLMLFGGSLVINDYAAAQNPIPKTGTPSTPQSKSENAGKTITVKTDDDGRPLKQETYDGKGDLSGIKEIDGYHPNGQPTGIEETRFEGGGRVTKETNKFNEEGRLTKFTRETSVNGVRKSKDEKEWYYDAKGRVLSFYSKNFDGNDNQIGGEVVVKEYADDADETGTTKHNKWDKNKKDYLPTPATLDPILYTPGSNDLRSPTKITGTPFQPTDDRESVILQTLPPGDFRAILPARINPTALPGFNVETIASTGLNTVTFTTPTGELRVNLPNDAAAGDTITGTIEEQPTGKTQSERAQNQSVLNGYVVEFEQQQKPVTEKTITCQIPARLTTEATLISLSMNGKPVATTQIPISATPPPAPTQFTLPTGGQQGRPIQIKGPCDGVFSPQDHVKVGPTILPPVAESPRSLVVMNTSDVIGPTNIECNENGATMQSPFRNIGINLSAPKLNLQRGETTTLHVVVTGLAGMTQSLPLDLVNSSANVIKMSGGEVQHSTINPSAVQRDRTYSIDRILTGIQAGAFVVTGTVTWTETYTKEVTGGVIAGGPGPVSQPSPTPLTPTDTAKGEVCKWINYKTYRVDEFKRVDSKDKNLEVRSASAHGGGVAVEFHCKAAGTFIFQVTKDSGSPDIVSVTCTQP